MTVESIPTPFNAASSRAAAASAKTSENDEETVVCPPATKPAHVEDEDVFNLCECEECTAAYTKEITPEQEKEAAQYDFGWIRDQFQNYPIGKMYPEIVDMGVEAMARWRHNLSRRVWSRLMSKSTGYSNPRIFKELNEIAPIIDHILEFVKNCELHEGEKITIVDLCSGFGYLSMFLAEMLPKDKMDKFVLVDKMWPHFRAESDPSTHISPEHITNHQDYWEIELHIRKQNLKAGTKSVLNMHERVFGAANGPVLLLAVHLCGTLSNRAVEMFNRDPRITELILKPCCLPGKRHYKDEMTYKLGNHSFNVKEVYDVEADESTSRLPKNRFKAKGKHEAMFNAWCKNLTMGIKNDNGDISIDQRYIPIQTTHFQNLFIYAARPYMGFPHGWTTDDLEEKEVKYCFESSVSKMKKKERKARRAQEMQEKALKQAQEAAAESGAQAE